MNKAICWKEKSDKHFTGNGTEYKCGNAYAKFEAAVVDVIDNNGNSVVVDINDPDFVFIFRNGYDKQRKNFISEDKVYPKNLKQYRESLLSKGFSLNEYPEGKFWELEVRENEKLKEKICKVFGADIELFVGGTDIDTLILQCKEDFTKCLFYYDCNPFDMETKEFMKCVNKI